MDKPRVLFVCYGNTCRSPMAEGLLRHMAGDRFEVLSAGLSPFEGGAQPPVLSVLREKGVELANHACRDIREFLDQAFDAVIFLCGESQDVGGLFKKAREVLYWHIEDPFSSAGGIKTYRRVRDDLERRILQWLGERGVGPA